uniref:RNA ligase/cyclic nucleotide phosphodiesterase n=1 Tax=Colletotrichum fructicola (strain Nara gc5) TaxID=1213859 RepID=L2GJ87_COLFN
MGSQLVSTDAKNKLEDLSGITIQPGENPYQALIKTCNNDPAEIQALYHAHRTRRNEQQKEKFLAADFTELIIDPFLLRLENPQMEPGFKDPRNCFVFWARPPDHIVRLAAHLQALLKKVAPSIWLMPQHRMHLTTLEVTHSKTPEEIARLTDTMRSAIPYITDYTYTHRARLVKPQISHDLSAFASTGVQIESRYQVPSAHITLGRFLGGADHATPAARRRWVEAIEEINGWLESEFWGSHEEGGWCGEWVVGQERGLDARNGPLWYGGGRTIRLGEGF